MHKLALAVMPISLPFGLAASLLACSSSSPSSPRPDAGAPPDAGTKDTSPGQVRDTGTVEATPSDATPKSDAAPYPAFAVDLPQIAKNQGTVLASPVIVTITWPTEDANAASWEGLGDTIGASSFWDATTHEYGVGPAKSGAANHVHMSQPLPTSIGYEDLQSYVQSAIAAAMVGGVVDAGGLDAASSDAGPNPAWPSPTTAQGNVQTIYSLFIPQSVTVTDPGSGVGFCQEGALGYHSNVNIGTASTPVAYSISLECSPLSIPDVEETAVHEYIEASTNPYPDGSSLGYVGFGPTHLAWDVYSGFNDELADACQNWADSYFQESGSFPYWVQRSWSNESAAAGHDPCAPRPAGAYYGMTLFPAEESMVSINLTSAGYGPMTTQGFAAKVGATVSFEVGFYSDAEAAPWTIGYDFPATTQLFDETGNYIGNGAAKVTLDKTSGVNGDKANVSVTVTTAGPAGFQIMAITWDPPVGAAANLYLPHYLPVIISNQ